MFLKEGRSCGFPLAYTWAVFLPQESACRFPMLMLLMLTSERCQMRLPLFDAWRSGGRDNDTALTFNTSPKSGTTTFSAQKQSRMSHQLLCLLTMPVRRSTSYALTALYPAQCAVRRTEHFHAQPSPTSCMLSRLTLQSGKDSSHNQDPALVEARLLSEPPPCGLPTTRGFTPLDGYSESSTSCSNHINTSFHPYVTHLSHSFTLSLHVVPDKLMAA